MLTPRNGSFPGVRATIFHLFPLILPIRIYVKNKKERAGYCQARSSLKKLCGVTPKSCEAPKCPANPTREFSRGRRTILLPLVLALYQSASYLVIARHVLRIRLDMWIPIAMLQAADNAQQFQHGGLAAISPSCQLRQPEAVKIAQQAAFFPAQDILQAHGKCKIGQGQPPCRGRYDDIIRQAARPRQMQSLVAHPSFQRANAWETKAAKFGFQAGQWLEPPSRHLNKTSAAS